MQAKNKPRRRRRNKQIASSLTRRMFPRPNNRLHADRSRQEDSDRMKKTASKSPTLNYSARCGH